MEEPQILLPDDMDPTFEGEQNTDDIWVTVKNRYKERKERLQFNLPKTLTNRRRLPKFAVNILRIEMAKTKNSVIPEDETLNRLMNDTGLKKQQIRDWFWNVRRRAPPPPVTDRQRFAIMQSGWLKSHPKYKNVNIWTMTPLEVAQRFEAMRKWIKRRDMKRFVESCFY